LEALDAKIFAHSYVQQLVHALGFNLVKPQQNHIGFWASEHAHCHHIGRKVALFDWHELVSAIAVCINLFNQPNFSLV
jgi:hypothetical protein